jgi:hypothetical protein
LPPTIAYQAGATSWRGGAGAEAEVEAGRAAAGGGGAPAAIGITPDGAEATARGAAATPEGEEATPDGEEATPDGEEATPDGEEATPDGEEATPDGEEATPEGEDAAPGAGLGWSTATEIRLWHCLQRILTDVFPATLSSAMTYFLPHLVQVTFTWGACRRSFGPRNHWPGGTLAVVTLTWKRCDTT